VFGSRIAVAMSGKGRTESPSSDMDGLAHVGRDGRWPRIACCRRSAVGRRDRVHVVPCATNPDLYIVVGGGGRARRVSSSRGLNTGASWSPDGRGLALTMSYEGNGRAVPLSSDGGGQSRFDVERGHRQLAVVLTDGGQIAFVSTGRVAAIISCRPGAAARSA